MATYQISEQLLQNRPVLIHTRNEGKPRSEDTLNPQGWVIHSTACPNVPAINIKNSFENHPQNQANSHYTVDYQTIIRMIPENEICWACGYTGNHKFIQVELCEFSDSNKFQEAWNRLVWLVAQSCVQHEWNTNDNVNSHRGISLMYPKESNHLDPIAYLQSHGKTWDELLQAIDTKIIELKNQSISNIQSINNNQGDEFKIEHAVFYFTERDFSVARMISAKLKDCAMYCRNGVNANIHTDIKYVKHPIFVGGSKYHDNPNTINCCGEHDYDTALLAANYAKTL